MEFHISKLIREKYGFDAELFSYNGNVILADFHAVRRFVERINRQRDLIRHPEQMARSGEINAMGLIDEIFHHVIHLYMQQKNPTIFESIDHRLESSLGKETYAAILKLIISNFPPRPVYLKEMTPEEYLAQQTDGMPNRLNVLEETLLYWIETQNPALEPYRELFDAPELVNSPRFTQVTNEIRQVMNENPKFGPENQTLIELLLSPAIAVPHSLPGQLEYIREHWSGLLGNFLYRLLTGLDLLKEENKISFGGPGPVEIPVYRPDKGYGIGEAEAFSPDREWMPRLVLVAKNTFVWLDQLSKRYDRRITRLDEIPNEELKELADRGFTGLWLIGLWERSHASARIKQLCGNPDAIASAYSLYSYEIAAELGGTEAYHKLHENAWKYGIRLASDMVPNHMAIDSDWVNQHPERFLSLDQCPYPSYTFNGPDLSSDGRSVIQIEDHYYDRSDAAVVFRRIDRRSGETKYIYHGNDGTSMPWNDTAQLNYLNPEVREMVIQTILDVARKFPIIRFDAAMTLAKKHYQRLWFPEPGSGGDIPSRAEHALTKAQFDQAMPIEFWREVVDRVAKEAPDTLLLAEAFWMMEGYFVRTLGMHRVYNSAFMNMLRNEDNAHYRQLLKNTLEFEPEILKRYVNFMNNPDERTAVDQFGKGDKYFGICTLMSTLPGLPMFGHGQFEGLTEKYGMEFRRAYLDEHPDGDLLQRHYWQISPLLHQREIFAGVENFWLFDFYTRNGSVDENVFAFTNQFSDRKSLVVYNNAYQQTEGWIRMSTSQLVRSGNQKRLEQREIAESLAGSQNDWDYLIYHDQITGLQYLRPRYVISGEGMHFKLNGYETHVLLDFHTVKSDAWHDYNRLYELLGENGVPDIDQALASMVIQPILNSARMLFDPDHMRQVAEFSLRPGAENSLPGSSVDRLREFLRSVMQVSGYHFDLEEQNRLLAHRLTQTMRLPHLAETLTTPATATAKQVLSDLTACLDDQSPRLYLLVLWGILADLGKLSGQEEYEDFTLAWLDEWQILRISKESLSRLGFSSDQVERTISTLRMIILNQRWYSRNHAKAFSEILKEWMSSPEIQQFLRVNRFEDKIWFEKESFTEFQWWMSCLPVLEALTDPESSSSGVLEALLGSHEILAKLEKSESHSEYQLDKLIQYALSLETE